jgi:NADH:ubiquinone oxidoreductase subunit 6 (subunit J)
LLVVILLGIIGAAFTISEAAPLQETIKPLGKMLFGDAGYLLTVEIAAVLLLSAILGAIAVIREK